MAKVRSPVLGFNHNVRHAGWLFHVQTEDSGVANPHIYTHLFHDGVILASKKMVYDNAAAVDIVKGLMQAQHKSVLKELKSGQYDEKIKKYLGAPPPESDYDDVSIEKGTPVPMEMPADMLTAPTALPVPPVELPPVPPIAEPARAKPPTVPPPVAEPARAKPPTRPPPVAEPARAKPPTVPPPPSDPNSDVSAAFRAMAAASANVPLPPPAAPVVPAEDEMVFVAGAAAPIPPGTGAWSGKPEITQERPFDKSGSFPAVRPPGEPRNARSTSSPSLTPPTDRPASRPGVAAKPGTIPPPGAPRPPTMPPSGMPPRPTIPPSGAPRPATMPPPTGTRPPTGNTSPGAKPPTAPPAGSRPVVPARSPTTPPAGAKPPTSPPAGTRPGPAPNVIVARPAVIVGAPPQIVGGGQGGGTRPPGSRPRETTTPPADSIFGKDLISEKSLDEVIMAYLSEDQNDD